MRRGFISLSACLSLLAALSSCSWSGFSAPIEDRLPIEPLETAGGEDSQPFTLTLLHEQNDGKELRLAGTIRAHSPYPSSSVLLRATAYEGGEAIHSKEIAVSQLMLPTGRGATELKVGEEIPFSFALPASRVSTYNLELVWGKQVRSHTDLKVEDVRLEAVTPDCEEPPCATTARIVAKLVNDSSLALQDIVLGIGFVVVPDGAASNLAEMPTNEKRLALKGIILKPGEQRPLRLNLDRALPASPQGRYQPVVRVLSFR